MAYWRATNAKAKFSALLSAAETEGPQLIHRRTQTFIVTTKEEMEMRFAEGKKGKRKKFVSAWDALRLSLWGRRWKELVAEATSPLAGMG